MTLLRPDRAIVQTDRRLRDAFCTRHQTCHGIPISWTTLQRPRASARISRGAVRTVEVSPCEGIRCAIPARVAEGRHHHSSTSDEGMALHRCWNPYPTYHSVPPGEEHPHGQSCECSRPAGGTAQQSHYEAVDEVACALSSTGNLCLRVRFLTLIEGHSYPSDGPRLLDIGWRQFLLALY